MLWLSLYFPSLQLDNLNQDLMSSSAIAIVDAKKNVVLQSNERAVADGVCCGLGIAMAASLSAQLTVFEYQEKVEVRLLTAIADVLYQITADIVIQPPNVLLLNVEHMKRLYGSLSNYWQLIVDNLSLFNVKYFAAFAYSCHAANTLTKMGINIVSSDKRQIEEKLLVLPIESLFLPKSTLQSLQRVGIKTIKQLYQLPLSTLNQRFTHELGHFLEEFKGNLPARVNFYQPVDKFAYSQELMFEISDINLLLKPITKILKILEKYLLQRDFLCQQLTFCFYNIDKQGVVIKVSSVNCLYKVDDWLALIKLKLEQITLSSPIITIDLRVENFVKKSGKVDDLFTGQQGAFTYPQLLSLLLNKLGETQVKGIRLSSDHQPEKASQYCSFFNNAPPLAAVPNSSAELLPLRPSFLLAQPEKLSMSVSLLHGPERINTGWWLKRAVNRDYFIARNKQGQWCWVFREPDEQWFLHGYFA